jgi:hypothetical protein
VLTGVFFFLGGVERRRAASARPCECFIGIHFKSNNSPRCVRSSVSLFAAALLFSAPAVECSIYSTCKRISQKLLRNVKKFLDLVFVGMDMHPFKVVRSNCEELVLQGPEGKQDLRVVNSYPSKVFSPFWVHLVCA